MIREHVLVLLLALVAVEGCSKDSPTTPTPPPPPVVVVPDPPTLACPAAITRSTTGTGVEVSYETPAPEGGQTPVTVACDPPSGGSFAVGSRDVTCTATDARNRTASCTFAVTVSRIPILSKTRFLSFGDSITRGTVSVNNPNAPPPYLLSDSPNSYPTVLTQLLSARYSSQAFSVINAGKGGEKAVDAVGRAGGEIDTHRPEVALFLTGYNDLSTMGEAGIAPAIAAINSMLKDARFRGARAFVGTLTPPPVGVNRGISNTTIARFNEELRVMARGEVVVVVDVYAALAADPNRYISADGRHPNEEGYRKIAEAFLAAIRAELEVR